MNNNVEYKALNKYKIDEYDKLYRNVFSEEPWLETFEKKKAEDYFTFCCDNELFSGFAVTIKDEICGIAIYYMKPSVVSRW